MLIEGLVCLRSVRLHGVGSMTRMQSVIGHETWI